MAKSLKNISLPHLPRSVKYQHSNHLEIFTKNSYEGVHKSYGIHWIDILELNDAGEMAKQSAVLVGLIYFGFMGATSFMLF
jgi:hypothetical protein